MSIYREQQDKLLLELASEHAINEQWVKELMHLVVQKYPPSNLFGNKKKLMRDVQGVIEQAMIVEKTGKE